MCTFYNLRQHTPAVRQKQGFTHQNTWINSEWKKWPQFDLNNFLPIVFETSTLNSAFNLTVINATQGNWHELKINQIVATHSLITWLPWACDSTEFPRGRVGLLDSHYFFLLIYFLRIGLRVYSRFRSSICKCSVQCAHKGNTITSRTIFSNGVLTCFNPFLWCALYELKILVIYFRVFFSYIFRKWNTPRYPLSWQLFAFVNKI